MHNLHFVSVSAEDCLDAIEVANDMIQTANSSADYFLSVGAFNINNPKQFMSTNDSHNFNLTEVLGANPDKFVGNLLDCLNSNIKSIDARKTELLEVINISKDY